LQILQLRLVSLGKARQEERGGPFTANALPRWRYFESGQNRRCCFHRRRRRRRYLSMRPLNLRECSGQYIPIYTYTMANTHKSRGRDETRIDRWNDVSLFLSPPSSYRFVITDERVLFLRSYFSAQLAFFPSSENLRSNFCSCFYSCYSCGYVSLLRTE